MSSWPRRPLRCPAPTNCKTASVARPRAARSIEGLAARPHHQKHRWHQLLVSPSSLSWKSCLRRACFLAGTARLPLNPAQAADPMQAAPPERRSVSVLHRWTIQDCCRFAVASWQAAHRVQGQHLQALVVHRCGGVATRPPPATAANHCPDQCWHHQRLHDGASSAAPPAVCEAPGNSRLTWSWTRKPTLGPQTTRARQPRGLLSRKHPDASINSPKPRASSWRPQHQSPSKPGDGARRTAAGHGAAAAAGAGAGGCR
mmetsp:Transcript_75408/g.245285  ORF Transcript_75408/g.245285 Transcript_75408/m.245285 type:complete len:258 (+) Transcript_75408:4248-5021(+)